MKRDISAGCTRSPRLPGKQTQHLASPPQAAFLLAVGLFCLAPVPASAQLQDLATTDDGSVLYFSSAFRLRGSTEYANAKIFRLAGGTYDLSAQVVPTGSNP